jgi:septal ring factor EnvC (AmiA/AmiB activator)
MVSKGYENFVSQENDSATFIATKKFLNSFLNKTDMYAVGLEIDEQKKSLATSEKKWQDLRDKQQEGRKKITQLEADLKNWQQEEVNQQKEVDSQRAALQELEAKRSAIQQ